VAWWMQQAYAPVLGAKLQDPAQSGDEGAVLDEFCRFMRLCDAEAVWAHGATYDFPILETALARCRLDLPWGHRAPRDTRTLFCVAPGGKPEVIVDETRKHDALYDCEVQVRQVCGALKALRAQADNAALIATHYVPEVMKLRAELGRASADCVRVASERNALAAEVERWKEEYRVTEEARAAFEAGCGTVGARKVREALELPPAEEFYAAQVKTQSERSPA
jgi:hypothetical protein